MPNKIGLNVKNDQLPICPYLWHYQLSDNDLIEQNIRLFLILPAAISDLAICCVLLILRLADELSCTLPVTLLPDLAHSVTVMGNYPVIVGNYPVILTVRGKTRFI